MSRICRFDVTIKHPLTLLPFRLHAFKHKGYWFHKAKRESAELGWFQRLVKPGQTVWEIGAHTGFVTQYFAHIVGDRGTVIAFEPGPENLTYLRKNIIPVPNTTIEAVAVCDRNGMVDLNVEDLTGQNNSLVDNLPVLDANIRSAGVTPKRTRIQVPSITLDAFRKSQLKAPDFIKIDVEGVELQVLRGATGTLQLDRPFLMVELMLEPERSLRLLRGLGYRCFYVDGVEVASDNLPTALFTNVFAIPAGAPEVRLFTRLQADAS